MPYYVRLEKGEVVAKISVSVAGRAAPVGYEEVTPEEFAALTLKTEPTREDPVLMALEDIALTLGRLETKA